MAIDGYSCVIALSLLCTLPTLLCQDDYTFPEVSFVALKPWGLVMTIPDGPNLTNIYTRWYVFRPSEKLGTNPINANFRRSKEGFWTHRDDSIVLKVDDIITYSIHIMLRNEQWLESEDLKYTVRELLDSNSWTGPTTTEIGKVTTERSVPKSRKPAPMHSAECKGTSTIVLSPGLTETVCSGQIIFEDNFDTLREDVWTIEEYIPSKPEYPFVSYQRPRVSVENGILRIQPQLQENLPGFDSAAITYRTLDLSMGCTRPGSCVVGSDGGYILPPIASGRITSNMFSFKYGSVEVRAKVPQGDWLYPDIFLESLLKKYGVDDYASGILRIAGVLGNGILKKGQEEYGNKVLSGGPVMDFKCRTNLLVKKVSRTEWGEDFHVYSLRWEPDAITLSVDGEEWGRIEAPTNGLQTRLPRDSCGLVHRTFLKTPMAPFDDYFSIILGVSAGGVSEFPDDVVSLYTTPKPWINTARRARLNFYTAKDSWLPTWTQPALLVDYIRVRAL